MKNLRNRIRCLVAAIVFAASLMANGGEEDLLLLASSAVMPSRHEAVDEKPSARSAQPAETETDKPGFTVSVFKLTLPPMNRPELAPLDFVTEIPGCVAPEIVAIDNYANVYGGTSYPARSGGLLDLPGMDAFPVVNLPVASAGVDSALPPMPVYRDMTVETLEQFAPAPTRGAPRPEDVRLPRPLESERTAALARLQPIASPDSQAFTLLPPPDEAPRLTASIPARAAAGGGGLLLAIPPGVALTASAPSMRQVPEVVPERAKPSRGRRKAPPLAERTAPVIAAVGEDGLTPVRGIKNLLGR